MNRQVAQLAPWRQTGIGLLRIVFGLIWAVDAWFKWQPAFLDNFLGYLTSARQDQPPLVGDWIRLWVNVVGVNPNFFAHLVALTESAIAIALILGIFTNLTALVGVLLSLAVWSTAEGFGGPYVAGSTDIGSAIIYVPVFVGLYLTQAGLYLGLDRRLSAWLGRLQALASGPVPTGARSGFEQEPVAAIAGMGGSGGNLRRVQR